MTIWINADVVTAGWVSTGATLYGAIEETAADDATYITSPIAETAASYPVRFSFNTSRAAGTWTENIRANSTSGTLTMRIRFLDAANASVGVSADQAITTTLTTYAMSVTTSATATQFQIEILL